MGRPDIVGAMLCCVLLALLHGGDIVAFGGEVRSSDSPLIPTLWKSSGVGGSWAVYADGLISSNTRTLSSTLDPQLIRHRYGLNPREVLLS